MPDIKVQLAPSHQRGLLLANPVMTASGTFGYGTELADEIDIQRLGAIICKGTTLEPREGNPQPRIVETAGGVLNSIGLQNIGVKALIREKAPVWAKWKVPVIVNIAGETIDEYVKLASMLEGVAGISGIELNISCPNISVGGIEFGSSADLAKEVTSAIKSVSSLPLIVKLSPNVTDITEVAVAVCKAGADAITLINTLRGMVIDINSGKPVLGNGFGGLCGPAIKPVALYMVYRVSQAVNVPVIGCGGIWKAEDAIEFFMAGATAIEVGLANMVNPNASLEILDGIIKFMDDRGIKKLQDMVGLAWKK